ncbi:MAG: GDP-mannose 4,6-dehydratase [Candidatus Korobacteraceae bacterium]
MNVLITGGAGFIGSHLTDYFLAEGHEVTVIDDLSTGSINNLRSAKKSPAFEFQLDTIFNRSLLGELVDGADLIFHLAAAVGVRNIVESPVRTIKTNVGGAEAVLEAAAKKNKRVLIASTSEVYGKSSTFPFREDDDLVLGPTSKARWSYACSKMVDEFLALAYYRERNLPVTVVRLFNTVGPRQTGRYGMVLPTFVQQALHDEAVTVFGLGEQSRCFTHVADVVHGLAQCAATDCTAGHVFNLGSAEEVTMNALAAKVIKAAGSASAIRHVSYEEAYGVGFEDMERRVPDTSKARQYFGYTPRHSLCSIVTSVIDYYREGTAGLIPHEPPAQPLNLPSQLFPATLSSTDA